MKAIFFSETSIIPYQLTFKNATVKASHVTVINLRRCKILSIDVALNQTWQNRPKKESRVVLFNSALISQT